MNIDIIRGRDFYSEFTFSASRSGGPGGQNVNKVSSKIELRFNVSESILLSIEEKEIIHVKLANKINNEGELVLVCQTERSQLANKEKVIEKFYSLISKALTTQKKRKPTKVPFKAKAKRLEEKRQKSEKKTLRKTLEN
ncbi:MAG: aminoacyl-tRNA hydrolase [Bacteroidales bacterium]|nr:MAG: aminoacyl-tRNA hydrolase [Bacteroidales bacterium]